MAFDLDRVRKAKAEGVDTNKTSFFNTHDHLINDFEDQLHTSEFEHDLEEALVDAFSRDNYATLILQYSCKPLSKGMTQMILSFSKSTYIDNALIYVKRECLTYNDINIKDLLSTTLDTVFALVKDKFNSLKVEIKLAKTYYFEDDKACQYICHATID